MKTITTADRYYFRSYRLFKIPFKILLTYHCPLGNTIHTWTKSLMLAHILAVRNDLHILNLGLILIQIRKALNSLYTRLLYRGSFLIYAEGFKALKIEHSAVFNFVTSWLPGLITNYKQIVTSLHTNRYMSLLTGSGFLSRPQMDALAASNANPVPPIIDIYYPKRSSKYGRIPSIALGVLDNFIWLNECQSLAIPSIQLCDTQSIYDSVTYPIIANQRSIPFTQLIIDLFVENCTFALMSQHHIFKYIRFKKDLKKFIRAHGLFMFNYKTYKKRRNSILFKQKKLMISLTRNLKPKAKKRLSKQQTRRESIKSSAERLILRRLRKIRKRGSLIKRNRNIKKPTYLLDKEKFTYIIRDLLPRKYKKNYKK